MRADADRDARIAAARAASTPHPGAALPEDPPDSGPVDDLDAVADRINKRLNDLYFEETSKASAMGISRPGAHVDEGRVYVAYRTGDDVTFCLSERAARAYERWLAAGNVGRHYEGDALREDVAKGLTR